MMDLFLSCGYCTCVDGFFLPLWSSCYSSPAMLGTNEMCLCGLALCTGLLLCNPRSDSPLELTYNHIVIVGGQALKNAAAEFSIRGQGPQVPFQTSKRHWLHSSTLVLGRAVNLKLRSLLHLKVRFCFPFLVLVRAMGLFYIPLS